MQNFLKSLWESYCKLNPAAKKIHNLFLACGEEIVNDHIALRTFKHPKLGIESLAQHFRKYGYLEKGEYVFEDKKLYAKHFESPDLKSPKIFISELELDKMPREVEGIINTFINKIPEDVINEESFVYSGRHWDLSHSDYLSLYEKSEYAAWVSAHGFQVNHFTISLNHLHIFQTIESINKFIKENGFFLNSSGGEIKGSPGEYLEQSSTVAEKVPVIFKDGTFVIPGCFYEFAKRYPLSCGNLYTGFVTASADKIFESTN
jgi:hypothetical protein